MSETKEENNTPSEMKEEEKPKEEDMKVDESSKDSDKDSAKADSVKEESVKGSEKEESDDDDESEEGMGLLDRPVEVTGCRARKKVERLELSFSEKKTTEKKHEIPVGRGDKLGDCARIEYHIQKTAVMELKPLHRVLFSRIGSANEIKKNIRKFSGFLFVKDSPEYEKKKAQLEKLTAIALKHMCEILDIERSGTKDEIVTRLLMFLLEPKDSGRPVLKKKSASKDKKKSEKKGNIKKPKVKKNFSSNEHDGKNESENDEASEDEDEEDANESADEKKSKNASKAKKTPSKTKKPEKKEKNKKEEKRASTKRKRDDISSDTSSDEDEKVAKKTKMPSDDEIKKLVKRILDAADLQEITMKKVIKQVADAYPDCDLSHKKGFIKTTIKSVIS